MVGDVGLVGDQRRREPAYGFSFSNRERPYFDQISISPSLESLAHNAPSGLHAPHARDAPSSMRRMRVTLSAECVLRMFVFWLTCC